MEWSIVPTKEFLKEIKKHKRNGEFVKALNNKVQRLRENPESVGGFLSGRLHGYKSTRIFRKFRLLFKIVEGKKEVYLSAIDHRKFDYKRV